MPLGFSLLLPLFLKSIQKFAHWSSCMCGVSATAVHNLHRATCHNKVQRMAKINVRRLIKSLIPVTCFGSFVVLLTLYIYNSPVPLGRLQRLGWQSFDIVSYEPSRPVIPPTGGTNSTSTEWWDTPLEEETKPISLPLDVWSPLLPHHTGRK
jgi:hypothetical protein